MTGIQGIGLFEWADYAPPTPEWAQACLYCRPDPTGAYDEALHRANHLPIRCPVCGEVSPNRLLHRNNHGISLGASRQHDALLCTSLWLRLNHLAYALLNRTDPAERDLTALGLGWRLAGDGEQLPPEGWPAAPGVGGGTEDQTASRYGGLQEGE